MREAITVCLFGTYRPSLDRTWNLLKGLPLNGINVIECHEEGEKLKNFWNLFKKHWRIRKNYDVMLIPFPGIKALALATFLTRKPIIYDSLVTFYGAYVFDRKIVKKYSPKAILYYFVEWLFIRRANIILIDTLAHRDYQIKLFGMRPEKYQRLWIGTNLDVFYPRPKTNLGAPFTVIIQGKFVSYTTGLEYVIEAARILKNKDIRFQIFGMGPSYEDAKQKIKEYGLTGVSFIPFGDLKRVPEIIKEADVILGSFGYTENAKAVIPFKVFEALAMKKCVLTGDTPAARELLEDGKTCLMAKMMDAQDIAQKILWLKGNPETRERIAEAGYQLYQYKLTPETIGSELKDIIEKSVLRR